MKRSRGSMRRLFMQSLECRCVMDASGFEMGTEVFQNDDLELSAMFQSASADSGNDTSTDNELVDETVDPDAVKVMYFSMFDQELCDLPVPDPSELDSDVDMVKRTVDETVASDDSDFVDETIFQTFGAPSQDDEMMETVAFHGVTFHFDVDQSGSLSRLDAEMLINYLSDFFRSEDFAAFAQSNSSEMLQMDVDGDAQLTPLDALIVINELNRTGALEANASSESSRLDSNSTLIASDDLRIRDMGDDSTADAAPLAEISEDESTDVLGKMSIARMTDFAMSDYALSSDASRLAGYKTLTLAKQDGTPFVISVDNNGKVSATSKAGDLEVNIGDDQVICVDGESYGLAVIELGGDFLLSKQAQADSDLMFA